MNDIVGGFPKTSVFGKATLDLREKAGLKPLFPEACPKTVRFQRFVN
ncbi:MAG: hypothetical protein LBQ38_00470 [Spirochaetaceae bacterium]|jgi:hypothetical protein|nr:hypothetical protein [Spirochaetaceae bacterium]